MSIKRGRRGGNAQAVKIVVTGPFAAGKTTLIRTISEITVLSTEKDITDETKSRKAETTVAMDFGRITIDHDLVLYLFGTPGQDRFDFMWEILGEGMLGYVLAARRRATGVAREAVGILAAFQKMAKVPFVVALNRAEGNDPDAESAGPCSPEPRADGADRAVRRDRPPVGQERAARAALRGRRLARRRRRAGIVGRRSGARRPRRWPSKDRFQRQAHRPALPMVCS